MSDDDRDDHTRSGNGRPERIVMLTVGPTTGDDSPDSPTSTECATPNLSSSPSRASWDRKPSGSKRSVSSVRSVRSVRTGPSSNSLKAGGGGGGSVSGNVDSPSPFPQSPMGLRSQPSVATSSGFSAIRADLIVDLEHRVYYPGAVVKGTVRLTVRRPTKFFALRLRISGKESMIIRKRKNASEVLTRQRETFWKQLFTLEGATKTHQLACAGKAKMQSMIMKNGAALTVAPLKPQTIPPGEYVYPFEVQIPFGAPPSFEEFGDDEDYAAIVYYAKAYLDIPGGGDSDLIGRTFFRVVSRVGVKQWKAESKPVADHKSHAITGCCGMPKGSVRISVEVPRCLVSIADDSFIPFRVVVNNTEGKEPVNRITIDLEHLLDVHADGEEEERRTIVASIMEARHIPAGKTDGVIGRLPLPEDCPPSMRGILFSSVFTLRVECDVPYAVDPVTIIPLTIVHRAESKEAVPPVALQDGYHKMTGICEYAYECPEHREADLQRMPLGGGGGGGGNFGPSLGPMMNSIRGGSQTSGAFDFGNGGDDDDELPTARPIDFERAARKRPDARWKFVPPVDYS